jgi:hypothetical protein
MIKSSELYLSTYLCHHARIYCKNSRRTTKRVFNVTNWAVRAAMQYIRFSGENSERFVRLACSLCKYFCVP